jgi:hypothetical protein
MAAFRLTQCECAQQAERLFAKFIMRAPPIVCSDVLRKAAAAPIRIPCAAIPTPPSEYIARTRRSHGSLLCTFVRGVYKHGAEAVTAELHREKPKE